MSEQNVVREVIGLATKEPETIYAVIEVRIETQYIKIALPVEEIKDHSIQKEISAQAKAIKEGVRFSSKEAAAIGFPAIQPLISVATLDGIATTINPAWKAAKFTVERLPKELT